jgi:hypothetical protein
MEAKEVEELWANRVKRLLSYRLRSISERVNTMQDLKDYRLEVSYERYLRENYGFSVRDWKLVSPVLSSLIPEFYGRGVMDLSNEIKNIPNNVFSLHFTNLVNPELFDNFVLRDLKFDTDHLNMFKSLIMDDNARGKRF